MSLYFLSEEGTGNVAIAQAESIYEFIDAIQPDNSHWHVEGETTLDFDAAVAHLVNSGYKEVFPGTRGYEDELGTIKWFYAPVYVEEVA